MLPMLRSVAPSLLTWLALIILMIVVVEATGPLPGLRWDRLQVWEGSAAHDAWSRVGEYHLWATTQQRGPQGGPRSGKIPRFAATYWKPLRSVGRNGFPAPHLPQINFLVDYIGVLKNPVSRAANAPAATIAGPTQQQ